MKHVDMSLIKSYHKGHWFSPSNMRFFNSKLPHGGYISDDNKIAVFVSSEQFVSSEGVIFPRKYTVRLMLLPAGEIKNISEFQAFESRKQAEKFALEYIRKYEFAQ